MSRTLEQIFVDNPITTNTSTDLMYFSQSPYTAGNDAGMTYADFSAQFGTPYTASALSRVNDTNVTVSLTGNPSTALLQATTMTLGWSGQLSVPRGGTGNSTFTAYSVICAGTTATSAFQNVSGVGSANQVLVSNGVGSLPSWQSVPGLTPSALTKVDDTNVTLTLGGTPATALLQATSLTLGWTGTLAETRGGTAQSTYTLGDTLYSSASNTLSKLAGNITTTKQYLSQTGNGAVSAAPSWETISGSDITGAALTKTDDTNVTLTLGGTPSTALLRAASITAGWTGQLSVARGGTGVGSFTAYAPICGGTTTTGALQSTTLGTSGTLMQSAGTSALPTFTTATYPSTAASSGTILRANGTNWVASTSTFADTYTASNILYSNGSNTVTGLATANNGVLVTSGSGVPSISSTLPSGLTIPGSGGLKSFQIFTSGSSATYTRPAGITSILVEVIGGGGAGGSGASADATHFGCAGGGGSGGYARLYVASASSTYTYTVGAGGTPGSAGNNPGGNGGTTTFSASSLQATGGTGGNGAASTAQTSPIVNGGGAAGVGSNGNFNAQGMAGTQGVLIANTAAYSGAGGSSIYGGGAPALTANGAGTAAGNYGSGGSGAFAFNANQQGGAGSAGLIIVWEFA